MPFIGGLALAKPPSVEGIMWQQIAIPEVFYIGERGKSVMFKTPNSYGHYTFFHPRSLVKFDSGYFILTYKDGWQWAVNKRNIAAGTYTRLEVPSDEFLAIWEHLSAYEYHVPAKIEPVEVEVIEELRDED